jgi:hypothetical protein
MTTKNFREGTRTVRYLALRKLTAFESTSIIEDSPGLLRPFRRFMDLPDLGASFILCQF